MHNILASCLLVIKSFFGLGRVCGRMREEDWVGKRRSGGGKGQKIFIDFSAKSLIHFSKTEVP